MSDSFSSKENNKISVIIPVYNMEKYLMRCLDSVLENSYRNLEVICVNDGSKDKSISILRSYEKKDKRVKVIDISNGGVSRARNIGLENVTGEFVAFIDSDDWIHRDYFRILMYYQSKYDTDITACSYFRSNNQTEDIVLSKDDIKLDYFEEYQMIDNHILKSYIWGRVYRTKCIGSCRFNKKINIAEDKVFNIELLSLKPQLKTSFIHCNLYYYFDRSDSAINKSSGLDFKRLSDLYIERSQKAEDRSSLKINLNEAFTNTFVCRYLTMFIPDKTLKSEIKANIKECLRMEKKTKPFELKRSLRLRLMAKIPLVYRMFRIITDRTMLEWEKNQKVKYKK